MERTSYPKTEKLTEKLHSMELPEGFREQVLNWFGEYEHGIANPSDIETGITFRTLSGMIEKVAKWVAAQRFKDASKVWSAVQSAVEANELKLDVRGLAALEDLLLSLR